MNSKLIRGLPYLCVISFIGLAALSFSGVFKMHFAWITAPLWIPLTIFVVVSSVALLIAGLIDLIKEK